MPLEREQITDALRECFDPEIPVNIVDLGLIYDVQNDPEGNVKGENDAHVARLPFRASHPRAGAAAHRRD